MQMANATWTTSWRHGRVCHQAGMNYTTLTYRSCGFNKNLSIKSTVTHFQTQRQELMVIIGWRSEVKRKVYRGQHQLR